MGVLLKEKMCSRHKNTAFLAAEDCLREYIVWKIRRFGVRLPLFLQPRRIARTFIDDESVHALASAIGKLLSKYCVPVTSSRPRTYKCTSRLLQHLFGFRYQSLRDKRNFTPLEVIFLTLSLMEARRYDE